MSTQEARACPKSEPADAAAPSLVPPAKAPNRLRRMAREPAVETKNDAREFAANAAPTSKVSQVLTLLRQSQGATLHEMVAATSWQPHSARAVLSGLRKKGHAISKAKQDGVTRYSIAGDAQ